MVSLLSVGGMVPLPSPIGAVLSTSLTVAGLFTVTWKVSGGVASTLLEVASTKPPAPPPAVGVVLKVTLPGVAPAVTVQA